MNARPWRVISLAVGIAALTAFAVRADVGSGSAKEPLFEDPTGTNFTCPSGATSTVAVASGWGGVLTGWPKADPTPRPHGVIRCSNRWPKHRS